LESLEREAMNEGIATLFELAVVLTALGLGIYGHRLRKRVPWLNKPKPARSEHPIPGFAYRDAPPALHVQVHADRPIQRPMQDAQAWLAGGQPQMQSIKLSTLADADNVLIVGPKGSGKTTVLRTLLSVRGDAQAIALDPHASPGKWPCMCIGGGLRWDDISAALRRMQRDMQSRFEELSSGATPEGSFPRRSYVGDEWLTINSELDGKGGTVHAGKMLISRLTQGRKVGECILVAAQNDTVESLGIQGNADLKGCFDYIVYLGSLVSTRAKSHGCPADIIEAATKADRVGVVWHPERNNWYVLIYDLAAVREGQVLGVSPNPSTGTPVSVRDEDANNAGTGLPYQYRTSTVPLDDVENQLDHDIKFLHSSGISWNRIGEQLQLKGQKQQRNARIRQALGMPEPATAELVEAK
jgi:hypothetical protein